MNEARRWNLCKMLQFLITQNSITMYMQMLRPIYRLLSYDNFHILICFRTNRTVANRMCPFDFNVVLYFLHTIYCDNAMYPMLACLGKDIQNSDQYVDDEKNMCLICVFCSLTNNHMQHGSTNVT